MRGQDRPQVEDPVADVDGQCPVRADPVEEHLDALAGQDVHRDRVGAEGVQRHQVEGASRLLLHRQPAVAHDHVDVRVGVAEVGEPARVLGDAGDDGVDLVEADAGHVGAVGRDGAGAQADDGEVVGCDGSTSRRRTVRPRRSTSSGSCQVVVEELRAVDRRAVEQPVLPVDGLHAVAAVEGPLGEQRGVLLHHDHRERRRPAGSRVSIAGRPQREPRDDGGDDCRAEQDDRSRSAVEARRGARSGAECCEDGRDDAEAAVSTRRRSTRMAGRPMASTGRSATVRKYSHTPSKSSGATTPLSRPPSAPPTEMTR